MEKIFYFFVSIAIKKARGSKLLLLTRKKTLLDTEPNSFRQIHSYIPMSENETFFIVRLDEVSKELIAYLLLKFFASKKCLSNFQIQLMF